MSPLLANRRDQNQTINQGHMLMHAPRQQFVCSVFVKGCWSDSSQRTSVPHAWPRLSQPWWPPLPPPGSHNCPSESVCSAQRLYRGCTVPASTAKGCGNQQGVTTKGVDNFDKRLQKTAALPRSSVPSTPNRPVSTRAGHTKVQQLHRGRSCCLCR